MDEDFIADVEAVLLEQEPPCTAKLFDFRKNQVRMVKVVPKRMWLDFNLKTLGVEVPLPEGDVPYVETETKVRKDGKGMKNEKFDQILSRRTELAEKIVRLLAESRTTCWEMEKVFDLVRQHAVVGTKDAD